MVNTGAMLVIVVLLMLLLITDNDGSALQHAHRDRTFKRPMHSTCLRTRAVLVIVS